ncbi:MAG: hypothetical protein LBC62_05555 [Treponema sp.]|nr:hypothetical protein [Treponema sp.]
MAVNPIKPLADKPLGRRRRAAKILLSAAAAALSLLFFVSAPRRESAEKTEYYLPVYFAFSNPCEACHDDADFYDFFLKAIAGESDRPFISFYSYNIFRTGKWQEFADISKNWDIDLKTVDLPVFAIGGEWIAGNSAIRSGALDLYRRQKDASLQTRPAWSQSGR